MSIGFIDKERLSDLIDNREVRQKSWKLLQDKHSKQLNAEQLQHDDIIITDSIDVYRNLPDKLLQAINWLDLVVVFYL